MAANDRAPGPVPVKPQGFGLETQTELPEYSPSYGATRAVAGLSVHTQADGKGPAKGAGLQIGGVVEGVEQKNGITTIRYGIGGRSEAVSFPNHKQHESGEDIPNPLMAVAEGVKEGDHFGLRIGREGAAVLSNATDALETKIHPDGRTESRPIEQTHQREQDRGISRADPP